MTPPSVPSIRKILVRVNNWIGDVVMITPAMRALRKRFPHAEITLLAKTWVLDALQGSPYCDRLLEYSRPGSHGGLLGRLRLIRELKRERFDLAVLFQKAFEAALFARAAGIPRRIGFRTDRRGWLLTDPLDEPDQGHLVEHFLRIAGALGCDTSDRRLSFHLDQASRDTASRFLRATGSDGPVLRVAFHPGASKPPRAWHAERFAAVAANLARRHGAKVLLLGGQGDRPTLDSMSRRVGPQAILPPEGQTIKEMAAVLERCHLLVCNDSGPMHVAVALRIPVVAVFGPGHPSRTGPYTDDRNFRVLYEGYPCSPCRQKFFEECIPAPSGKPFCMEDISEETVERACGELLAWAGADGVSSGAFFSERTSS
jgi:lipopolysaccharide heptosyltransferase II